MKLQVLKVKEWFAEKLQSEARRYNMWFDRCYNDEGIIDIEDGCEFLNAEVLGETEKALKVRISTGLIGVGSMKGWTTWVPKSCAQIVA